MSEMLLEEHGYFWWNDEILTENQLMPDAAVAGILKINSQGKISLELHGFLSKKHPVEAALQRDVSEQKTIQGLFKDSKEFALLTGTYENGAVFNTNSFSHQRFTAETCITSVRKFQSTRKSIGFYGFKVKLKKLEDWICRDPIEIKETKNRLLINYNKIKPKKYKLSDGTLHIEHNLSQENQNQKQNQRFKNKLTITENTYIELKTSRKTDLNRIIDSFSNLEELIIILNNSNICLDWPVVMLGINKTPCKLYYKRSTRDFEAPKFHHICIKLPAIIEQFGFLYDSWRANRAKLGPGLYLYTSTFKSEKIYLENKYVNLIWGLESLHRLLHPTSKQGNSKLVEKVSRILEKHTGNDKRWLKSKLENVAEPSLKERLQDLISKLPIEIEGKSLDLFCKECADLRNDISHFGGKKTDIPYPDLCQNIFNKSEALIHLYHALILQLTGINNCHIEDWLTNSSMSHHIKSRLQEAGLTLKPNLGSTTSST